MNYTQMFANGGKTNDQELIRGIQKILGVDDAQMEQLLQIGINKYGSLEGIGQALNEATQGLTQNSTPEEIQAAVATVFATNADSQMFKCGGKLQQLVSRFGRGGIAECGCGCGGVKLKQEGGIAPKVLQGSTPTRSAALAGLRTVRVPDTNVAKRRRIGAVRDNEGGLHLYESADVNGNSAQTAITIHPGDTVINQSVLRRSGWDPRIIKWGDDNYEPIMQRMRPFVNGVPYKQDGGIVLEDLPGHDVDVTLTRRQARQLAAQNKGFNNEQFSFALANAKNALRNQGLRGRELRERAREMAAGITPAERHIAIDTTPKVDLNTFDFNSRKETPTYYGSTELGTYNPNNGITFGNVAKIKEGDLRPVKVEPKAGIVYNYLAQDMIDRINGNSPSLNQMIFGTPYHELTMSPLTGREKEVAQQYYGYQLPKYTTNPTVAVSPIAMKCGGKVKLTCGGKPKAKEGIKLAKCGKKVKK